MGKGWSEEDEEVVGTSGEGKWTGSPAKEEASIR